MTASRVPVPDLLRRFVDTRHRLLAEGLRIETNDLELLIALDERRVLHRLAGLAPGYRFTLITEHEIGSTDRKVVMLNAGRVCTMTVGMTTIIMVDRDQRQVLSFIAGISAADYFETYLPFALESSLKDQDFGRHVESSE